MTPLQPLTPGRDGSRDASPSAPRELRPCPLCAAPLPSPRARYCSDACKQRAYRLRHRTAVADDLATLRQDLRRRRALVAHTVYECPTCEARFVGERRCPDCHRFCRALGLGGRCPDCDQPVLLADLLGREVVPSS